MTDDQPGKPNLKQICPNPACRTPNDVGAQYCVRCGQVLGVPADEAVIPSEVATPPGPSMPTTGTEMSALNAETVASPEVAPATHPAGAKWRVGTLSYTTGGLVLIFLLLLGGDFAISMRDRSIGAPIQYMLKRLHASDTLIAVSFTVLPPLLTLIIGPVVSFKSDRLRSRWGRRIPFLLVPAPFAAAAMVVISFSEPMGQAFHSWLSGSGGWLGSITPERWALIMFTPSWTIFEVAVVIAGAVLNGLVNDVVPRPLLGRFYGLFRAVSLGAGIIFNQYLIKYSESHYRVIFISLAALFLVGFGAMCLGVKEGEYAAPEPVDPNDSATRRFKNAIRTYFRECFNTKYYCWTFAAMSFAACTFLPINTFSALYAEQLGMPKEDYGKLLAKTYWVSLVLAWPLGWVVDKAHALRVSLLVMLIYAVTMLLAYAFVTSTTSFGVALIIHGVMSGTYFTTSAPLGQALFPRMKFAQFASAAGLVQSVLTMLLGVGLGQLLDFTHHNYRLTFLIGGLFGAVAVVAMIVVYIGFLKLGGMAGYVPPGEIVDDSGDSKPVARAH